MEASFLRFLYNVVQRRTTSREDTPEENKLAGARSCGARFCRLPIPRVQQFQSSAAHSTDPKDRETYKKALDSLWEGIDNCIQAQSIATTGLHGSSFWDALVLRSAQQLQHAPERLIDSFTEASIEKDQFSSRMDEPNAALQISTRGSGRT